MLGLIGLIIANQSSFQQKVTMQERHLCWPPTFFHGPAMALPLSILESSQPTEFPKPKTKKNLLIQTFLWQSLAFFGEHIKGWQPSSWWCTLHSVKYALLCIMVINTFHSRVRVYRTSCQHLPIGVRAYSYFQSHASSCLPERELLLAQWGARDCLQQMRTRLVEQDAKGCLSKAQITNITFIIGIHSQSGQ